MPSIARLLDSTGEFARASQKRYDDLDLIISTILEDGYDSETGKRAAADEPDPQPLRDLERRLRVRALDVRARADPLERAFRLAADDGDGAPRELPLLARDGAADEHRGIPEEYAELERFNEGYERRHFATGAAARRLGVDGQELTPRGPRGRPGRSYGGRSTRS